MRILLTTALFAFLIPMSVRADSDVQCPYEAVVDADDLYLRSGPGTKYYPTGKLQSGQHVTVRRLDPGGWLMIDPPEGTFSLIPAAAVERTGQAAGTVTEDEVKVVMGSDQELGRAVTQCELNQGDTVEILGEKILSLGGPSETWYQIRPPQGEYRWVHGKYIVPVDGVETAKQVRQDRKKADALRKVSAEKEEEKATQDQEKLIPEEPTPSPRKPRIDKSGAVSQTGPDLDVLVSEREQLKAIDHEWELMLERSPAQWKIEDIEQAYRNLQKQLTVAVLKRQIDYRLRSLDEYRRIHADLVEFQKITEATDRRDQELREGFVPPVVQPVTHEAAPANPAPVNSEVPPGTFPEAGETSDGASPPFESAPLTENSANREATPPTNPNQFVLTGKLIRTFPAGSRNQPGSTPQFALVAPNNQVLAFVHSTPQVGDITPYLNREVGINGSNWSRPGQQSNVYSVTQIAPLDGQAVRDSSTPQFAMPSQQPGLATQINGQSLLSQGNWQQPQSQQFGAAPMGGMNQPIPAQMGNQLSNGIQPVSGEQPAFSGDASQGQFAPGAVQGIPINDQNRAFSAYPPSEPGNPSIPMQAAPDQFQGMPPVTPPVSPQGQWQPATQMYQQQGQAYQRGNVIHRPPQYSNQKRSWWPFGRKD